MDAGVRPSAAASPRLAAVLLPAAHALSRYWKPFVLIQLAALVLVVAYYVLPGVRSAVGFAAELRARGGVVTAAIAGALAGGLLPEVAKLLTRIDPKPLRQRLHDTAFNLAFFAVSSTVVYYFYLLQSHLFGDTPDFATVAKKVALDQFGFTIFWATPFGLILFTFKAGHYSLAYLRQQLHPRLLKLRLPALLLPCWAFWLPMTTLIYCLPAGLQFALFSLALAAWSLLLVFIAQRPPPQPPPCPAADPLPHQSIPHQSATAHPPDAPAAPAAAPHPSATPQAAESAPRR